MKIIDNNEGGGGGTGDVNGPGSGNSTDTALVRWEGTSGTLLDDSKWLLNDAGRLTGLNETDSASVQMMRLDGYRPNPANDDAAYISLRLSQDGSDLGKDKAEYARVTWHALDIEEGVEDGMLSFGVVDNGTLTDIVELYKTDFSPRTGETVDLGSGREGWNDVYLKSGSVISFFAGDVTITHSLNTLTFNGASTAYYFLGGPISATKILSSNIQTLQGSDVASANTITLTNSVTEITGSTELRAIDTTVWGNGARVLLWFSSAITVKNNTAGAVGSKEILLTAGSDFVNPTYLELMLCEVGGIQGWRQIGGA